MSARRRILLALTLLLPAAALAGLSGPPAEDREQNRRDLVELQKKDPDRYARLQQEARAFLALPEEQRQRLVRLDSDLHAQPRAVQARLRDALHRYADWLESLSAADRQVIRWAPDGKERLRRIREVRDRQWRQNQPQAVREQLQKLQGDALARRIAQLHDEERQRRRDWAVAGRFWDSLMKRRSHGATMPSHISDLDAADQAYVRQYLRPLLAPADWDELEKAQGRWPRFPRLVVELADRHPPALDGPRGPTRLADLPRPVYQALEQHVKQGAKKRVGLVALVTSQEGKWPGFAVVVTRLPRKGRALLPPDFWPSRQEDLSSAVTAFLKTKLGPVLDEADRSLLRKAEGSWPAFPRTLQDLAVGHGLTVPWQTLPGPRGRWDNYRLERPADTQPVARKAKRRPAKG